MIDVSSCSEVPKMAAHLSVGKNIGLLAFVAALYPMFGDPLIRKLEEKKKLKWKRLEFWLLGLQLSDF